MPKVTFDHYRLSFEDVEELRYVWNQYSHSARKQALKNVTKPKESIEKEDISNFGGLTRCVIEWDNGTKSVGFSYCSPFDQFVYKEGRNKSKGRAIQDAYKKSPYRNIFKTKAECMRHILGKFHEARAG